MTDTSEKIRALFLTALMVVSVFGATVAFAGSAAAAGNLSGGADDQGSITGSAAAEPSSVSEGSSQNNHLFRFSVGSQDGNGNTDTVYIEFPDAVAQEGLSLNSIDFEYADGNDVQVDDSAILVDGTDNDGVDDTVKATLSPEETKGVEAKLDIDTSWPAVGSDTDYDISAEYQDGSDGSSGGADVTGNFATVTVTDSSGGATPAISAEQDPVEFDTDPTSDNTNAIELIVNRTVDASGYEYTLYRDDGSTSTLQTDVGAYTSSGDRIVLDLGSDISKDLTLNINDPNSDFDTNVTVTSTSATVQEGTSGNSPSSSSASDDVDSVVFQGGDVAVVADDSGSPATDAGYEVFETRTDDDDTIYQSESSPLFGGSTGSSSYVAVVDSDNSQLSSGEVYNVEVDSTTPASQLQIRGLGFNVSTNETSVDFNEGGSATVEANITANFGNRPVEVDLVDEDDDVVQSQDVMIDGDREVTASFDVSDSGNYTVEAQDVQSGVTSETDSIVVSEVTGDASFDSSIIETPRGGVANITLSLDNTETARVQIGDLEDVNYYADLTVTDGNEDGEVVLQLNTYESKYSVVDTPSGEDSDSVSVSERGADSVVLGAADYNANVSVSSEEQGVSTVVVTDRGTDEMVLWTTADDDFGDINSGGDVATFAAQGNLTQDSTVAAGDTLVHQIKVTGIYGLVQDELAKSNVDSAEEALANIVGTDAVDLTMVQTNPQANEDPKVLDLEATSTDALNVVTDNDNGTLYVSVDTSEAVFKRVDIDDNDFGDDSGQQDYAADGDGNGEYDNTGFGSSEVSAADDDEFEVTFFIGEESNLADDDESVSATYTVVERTASFDTSAETADGDPLVTVQNASNQTISGTTSVAPGTNVTVRARATGDNPFLKTQEVEVHDHGDGAVFHANLDFSDVSSGTNFTLTVPNQGFEDDAETDGRVAPAPTASVSISNQTTDGTTVTVDSASLSNGGFVTIHDGSLTDSAFDSVRGTSAYLEAGSHSDIEVSLDAPYESDGTVIAMPHQDTNGNEAYDFVSSDGADDGPYTADGAAVTDDASLTVDASATPTPTPTPTEETPDTATDTEGQPGFGAALAIVALAGAALLALRRE